MKPWSKTTNYDAWTHSLLGNWIINNNRNELQLHHMKICRPHLKSKCLQRNWSNSGYQIYIVVFIIDILAIIYDTALNAKGKHHWKQEVSNPNIAKPNVRSGPTYNRNNGRSKKKRYLETWLTKVQETNTNFQNDNQRFYWLRWLFLDSPMSYWCNLRTGEIPTCEWRKISSLSREEE